MRHKRLVKLSSVFQLTIIMLKQVSGSPSSKHFVFTSL